jgi:hypothetical protein
VVIELWAVEAFCLTPVIACLFFVAAVLSMLEMQVSPYRPNDIRDVMGVGTRRHSPQVLTGTNHAMLLSRLTDCRHKTGEPSVCVAMRILA